VKQMRIQTGDDADAAVPQIKQMAGGEIAAQAIVAHGRDARPAHRSRACATSFGFNLETT